MSYIDKTITEATEPQLIKAFIAELIKSSKITCNKTANQIDSMYADTTATTNFTITIDNIYQLNFTRSATNDTESNCFTFTVSQNGTLSNDTYYLEWETASNLPNTEISRTLCVKIIENNYAVFLSFGYGKNTDYNIANNNIFVVDCDDETKGFASLFERSTGYVSMDFINNLVFSDGLSGTITNRMNTYYDQSNPTAIEIINNKLYKNNNILLKKAKGIYDCSLINGLNYNPIKVSTNSYYVMNQFTIIPY